MNKPLTLVAIAAPALMLSGCGHNSWNTTYYHAQMVPLNQMSGTTDIDLTTNFGDIDVAPVGTPVSSWALKHYSGEIPDGPFLIAIAQSNDELRPATVTVTPTWGPNGFTSAETWPGGIDTKNGEGVSYTLRLPSISSVTLFSNFGDLEIVGATGPVNAETDFGDIDLLANQSPEATLTSDHGDIEFHDITGSVYAFTDHGDIEGEALAGTVEARTNFGDIDLRFTQTNTGPFTAITDFGDVDIAAGTALTGQIEMGTNFGDTLFTGFTSNGSRLKVSSDDQSMVNLGEGATSIAKTDHGDVRIKVTQGD